jgi:DNA-binding response OmpR family regulator
MKKVARYFLKKQGRNCRGSLSRRRGFITYKRLAEIMKIVIAERDNHEGVAIEWLISTYSIPINNVFVTKTVKETMAILEKEVPEILYLELDMIPAENWSLIKRYVKNYSPKIIAVTAEATFERAKQAIELGSVDLLVKPLDPVKIRQCLQMALSLAARRDTINEFSPHKDDGYSYRTLFLEEEQNNGKIALMLLHTENNKKLAELLQFLTYFPFREHPTILPLTDMVVCLFKSPTKHIREEAWKILREWEAFSIEPVAAVIIPPNTEMKSVHDMYLAARRLLEMTFFIGYHQVILPKEGYECWFEMDPFLTSAQQREWVDMLNSFDKWKRLFRTQKS